MTRIIKVTETYQPYFEDGCVAIDVSIGYISY